MIEWKPYDERRLIARVGSLTIVKPIDDVAVPLDCSNCGTLYMTRDDEITHEKFGCCEACANDWAYANSSKWSTGWRPSQVEVQERVRARPPMRTSIDLDVEP